MAEKIEPDVVWSPTDKQALAFSSTADALLYGGSVGGGKTDFAVALPLEYICHAKFNCLVLRQTCPELQPLVTRARRLYPQADPGLRMRDASGSLRVEFASGARVLFSHANRSYDGDEFDLVIIDEASSFSYDYYTYILSRLRTTIPGFSPRIVLTAMPKGPGCTWIEKEFIRQGPYRVRKEVFRDPTTGIESTRRIQYIPARIEDNPYLFQNDPGYLGRLWLQGSRMYNRLRMGDWSEPDGSFFQDLSRSRHMVPPCRPPLGAPTWAAMDWGYSSPYSIGWYYEHDGAIVRHAEAYGGPDHLRNEGARRSISEVAKIIRDKETAFGAPQYRVGDPSIWQVNDGGLSIGDQFAQVGIYWERAVNDRITGWLEVLSRLQLGRFFVAENCRAFWATVPVLGPDKRCPEDLDTRQIDHVADEVRYSLMTRQLSQYGVPAVNVSNKLAGLPCITT